MQFLLLHVLFYLDQLFQALNYLNLFPYIQIANVFLDPDVNLETLWLINCNSFCSLNKSIFSNISSVTVVAPNCLDADVLATALNVLSYDEGLKLIDSLDGYEALWLIDVGNDKEFKVEYSSGMPLTWD